LCLFKFHEMPLFINLFISSMVWHLWFYWTLSAN
jgi:hypothetical protein